MPELSFYNDQKLFLKVQLGAATIRLGSSESCEVQLPHEAIDPCHARISPDETGEFWIEDLSHSGTRLNDSWISGRAQLESGNRIYIQDYVLIFRPDARLARGCRPGAAAEISATSAQR